MTVKTKRRIWIGGAFFTLPMMAFSPSGSFDPGEVGFWTSVGAGILWALLMRYTLGKYQKNGSES